MIVVSPLFHGVLHCMKFGVADFLCLSGLLVIFADVLSICDFAFCDSVGVFLVRIFRGHMTSSGSFLGPPTHRVFYFACLLYTFRRRAFGHSQWRHFGKVYWSISFPILVSSIASTLCFVCIFGLFLVPPNLST